MKYIAVYPGTFDPLTYGHLDIIIRASKICDELVVGVADNTNKSILFSSKQRVSMIKQQINKLSLDEDIKKNIKVCSFVGLLTDFARNIEAKIIIRGLRAVSDFEYEFQMASTNKRLKPDLDTVFLTASEQQHFVASSLVKEVARLEGDIKSFVPIEIAKELKKYFKNN